jgi:WD40 repeat protein
LAGSQLLQWCYRHLEEQAEAAGADRGDDDDALVRRREEEHLLRTAPPDYPCVLASSVDGLHPANVCAIACWQGAARTGRQAALTLVSGSADGVVRSFSPTGELLAKGAVPGGSGVLTLALHEGRDEQGGRVIAAGCMDGSVCLLDGASLEVLASGRPHAKYVVALRWACGGRFLVSGGWDSSFAVLRVGKDGGGGGGRSLAVAHTEACCGQVEDVCVLQGGASFLVATRGTNYLDEYEIVEGPGASRRDGAAAGGPAVPAVRVRRVARRNMNSSPLDHHVSFSAMRLALSPCGRLLAVSADSGRVLIYSLSVLGGGLRQARLLFLPIEKFHHHRLAWHRSGCWLLAAAAHGAVVAFEVASGRAAARVAAHQAKGVRDLHYHIESNTLVTCAFDRTLKVWGPEEEA